MTRRQMLQGTLAAGTLAAFPWLSSCSQPPRLRIGACDWSLGKGGDPAAFDVAKTIGLAGVMVSMGDDTNHLHLRRADMQASYREAAARTGVQISSLALGILNDIPYKSDLRTEQWVSDSIDVAAALKAPVILLAFFGNGDLRDDDAGIREVIRRLRIVAPKAEKSGVTLGIESYLSAPQLMDIMQQVGSPAVKVYYDFRNSADAGYDVIQEIRQLGKDNICELHMKENGQLLGQGTLDWPAIARTLQEIGYIGDGWMQLEWGHPKDADIVASYRQNVQYLNNIFQYS
ncbi:MAG: sugar phosphate isomerase/epimerase [Cyclobacteriaceae bacterium]|nr:sugar phosphate isomerase/epimerase [Cyclobacteriaceae bacterium]